MLFLVLNFVKSGACFCASNCAFSDVNKYHQIWWSISSAKQLLGLGFIEYEDLVSSWPLSNLQATGGLNRDLHFLPLFEPLLLGIGALNYNIKIFHL